MSLTTLTPKEKKSYTLSSESVKFLEAQREKLQTQSVSAALEEILQAVRRQEAQAAIDDAITKYYDSLTDEEVEEDRQWGQLGLQHFMREDA